MGTFNDPWFTKFEQDPGYSMSQVGYEALHNAGHRKNELKNFKCGVFVGDSGGENDWFKLQELASFLGCLLVCLLGL